LGLGAIYGKQQDLALIAKTELTETTRKAFVAGINNACLSKERSDPRNRRLGVTDKQIIEYCDCMSASAGRVLTPLEFEEAVKNNGTAGQSLQQKFNDAYPGCFSAASK
jgi:hypothetical protein